MQLDVLVLDAQFRQSLLCLQRYARSGLRVACAACESEQRPMAFASRYASVTLRLPDVAADPASYARALVDWLKEHPTRVVLPAHDGTIDAIRGVRTELEAQSRLALASNAALDVATNKERTLALARELGIRLPRGATATTMDDVRAAVRELGFPVVIKPSESWARSQAASGKRLYSTIARDESEAFLRAERILSHGIPALVQMFLPGLREAVSLFYAGGRVFARFAQKSYREWPILGGASSLYESIGLAPDLAAASERLVRAMDLEGCSLIEFRRDREERPALMEVNPRMAGSVGLAVACGVDFPKLALAHGLGEPLTETSGYVVGKRMRWLAGDIRNLQTTLGDQAHPDAPKAWRAVGRFVADFVVRPSALDPFDLDDLRPAWAEMNNLVFSRVVNAVGGILRGRTTPPGVRDW